MRALSVLVGLWIFTSCENNDFSTGSQFFDGVSFQFNVSDTLTMNFSTVKLDSIITSNPEQLIIGNLSDSTFGLIKASAYVQIFPDSIGYTNIELRVKGLRKS